MKVNICGVNIDNVSYKEVLHEIDNSIKNKENIYFVTPNVDHVIKLQKDSLFKKIYENARLVLADGMPLLWAAKILGTPLKEKISGSDLFPQVCEFASEKGYKLFFLGGRQGAVEKARNVLIQKYPKLLITGIYSPPFGFENIDQENNKIIDMIVKSKPDILFVGLGAPKQEKWIYKYKKQLNVPVAIGIGVTFEFIAGMVKRAPVWMQKIGLEWFWRLIMEPKRLWRRYLIEDMQFLKLFLRQKFQTITK